MANRFEQFRFDVCLAALDAEHRGQFERMNRLADALAERRPADEIAARVADLIAYLDAHFAAEQTVMRDRMYPEHDAHVREHDEASTLVRRLGERCGAADVRAAAELLAALRGWLVDHVDGADRALARYLGTA